MEERVKLVSWFYQKVNSTPKTTEESEILVTKKYRKFPQLVAKLEGKYNVDFDNILPRMEGSKKEDL